MKSSSVFCSTPAKLCSLTGCHFYADFTTSVLPGFLPALLVYYNLDLSLGVIVISTLTIGSNLVQILIAKAGERLSKPYLLILGVCMASMLALIGILPRSTPFWVLCILMILAGTGNALVHPNGLRGLRNLQAPAGVVTPLFMAGGFFGAAAAPWISGTIVSRFGIRSLLVLIPFMLVAVLSVVVTRIRLYVEQERKETSRKNAINAPWSFAAILLISTAMNTGTTSLNGLLTYMYAHEYGFSMGFGGFATMLFGLGSSATSMLLGFLSVRKPIGKLMLLLFAAGVPVSIVFLLFPHSVYSIIPGFLTGALAASAFPIFVSMAPYAKGKTGLAVRNGLLVGGTWGIAGILFLGIGSLADRFGAHTVLLFTVPACYLTAFLLALLLYKKNRN